MCFFLLQSLRCKLSYLLCLISAIIAIFSFCYMLIVVASRDNHGFSSLKFSITNIYMLLSDVIAIAGYSLFVYECKCTGCSMIRYVIATVASFLTIVFIVWFASRNRLNYNNKKDN